MLGRRVLLGALVIVNLYLLLTLVWGGSGVFAYLDLKDRHQSLEFERDSLEERSVALSGEIRSLTSDPVYQRQVVRERMNYVGEKEVLYIFPQTGGGAPDQAAPGDGPETAEAQTSEADDEQ